MKFIKIFTLFLLISIGLNAQHGFFGRLDKFDKSAVTVQSHGIIQKTKITLTDSTFGAIRPILIPVAFSIPDNQIMAGAGFGYQNITYNFATGKYYCNWSINLVGFMGGSVVPTVPSMATSYGITVGFLNNSANVGVKFNSRKDPQDEKFKVKPNAVLAYYVNFNN